MTKPRVVWDGFTIFWVGVFMAFIISLVVVLWVLATAWTGIWRESKAMWRGANSGRRGRRG